MLQQVKLSMLQKVKYLQIKWWNIKNLLTKNIFPNYNIILRFQLYNPNKVLKSLKNLLKRLDKKK